jgi:four helix bundle protein
MPSFDHERLDAYQVGLDFIVLADALVATLPRGRAHLAEQFQPAATAICLNIAEGAGEFSVPDKIRVYRMARRSATECAAILDVLARLAAGEPAHIGNGRDLLLRVVSMLTRMAQRRTAASHGEV